MTPPPAFALLSIVANIERHKLASGEPWLLLMDLRYPGDADPDATQEHVRLVRNTDAVTFDAGDGAGPQEYAPFSFEMGDLTVGGNGQIPETEIQASNVMRGLQNAIEPYGLAVGANLNLYVVNTASPAGEPDLAMEFTVKQTVADAKLVHFKLGASSPLRKLFPLHMYRPNYCIHRYNSPTLQAKAAANPAWRNPGKQCAYVGPLATCTHTIDGTNGCKAHSNLVRFGGFPDIDSNGYVSAGVA